jgi:CheY-like chemotaxis protein
MEPESIEWLFDAFSQGPRSMDRADGGLGLGLTLVKQLVELHAGRIDAHSDGPGRGSRFTVSLPLAIGAAASKEQAEPAARLNGDATCTPEPVGGPESAPESEPEPEEGQRVLVVDDNQEVLESAVMLLNAMGHEAYGVSSGAEALAAIAEAPPSLVLLDIGLPEMDGIEVARRLSAMPERARLKLVAVSGYAASTLGNDAALFDDHLLKPAGRTALRSVLPRQAAGDASSST